MSQTLEQQSRQLRRMADLSTAELQSLNDRIAALDLATRQYAEALAELGRFQPIAINPAQQQLAQDQYSHLKTQVKNAKRECLEQTDATYHHFSEYACTIPAEVHARLDRFRLFSTPLK